jgi:hypothetical protein
MLKLYMYVFTNTGTIDKGLVNITENNYINNTPLEDFGDYLLSPVPVKDPLNMWFKGLEKE